MEKDPPRAKNDDKGPQVNWKSEVNISLIVTAKNLFHFFYK